jgi:hypothetical protein
MHRRHWDILFTLVGVYLTAHEINRAVLVYLTTALLLLGALGIAHTRARGGLDWPTGRFSRSSLTLALSIVIGLWIGVYLVFAVAQLGLGADMPLSLPIRSDGLAVTPAQLLRRGVSSAFGIVALLAPWRAHARRISGSTGRRILGFGSRPTPVGTPVVPPTLRGSDSRP